MTLKKTIKIVDNLIKEYENWMKDSEGSVLSGYMGGQEALEHLKTILKEKWDENS